MHEVHCFGAEEGNYKLRGKWVSIFHGGRWGDYPVGTNVDLCPVCDLPIRVFFIKGSSYIATCTPKHTQMLMRRNKEGLCVRCGKEFGEFERRFHNEWFCRNCSKKTNDMEWYAFNLRRSNYGDSIDAKTEYWHNRP